MRVCFYAVVGAKARVRCRSDSVSSSRTSAAAEDGNKACRRTTRIVHIRYRAHSSNTLHSVHAVGEEQMTIWKLLACYRWSCRTYLQPASGRRLEDRFSANALTMSGLAPVQNKLYVKLYWTACFSLRRLASNMRTSSTSKSEHSEIPTLFHV